MKGVVIGFLVLSGGTESAWGQTSIARTVFGTGGGATSSPSMTLVYTIGEPVTGTALATSMSLHAGFWHAHTLPPCYADCDVTGVPRTLDIFDFLCFLISYTANEPYACDCDTSSGPGICDTFDFLCFQNAFAAGCP